MKTGVSSGNEIGESAAAVSPDKFHASHKTFLFLPADFYKFTTTFGETHTSEAPMMLSMGQKVA